MAASRSVNRHPLHPMFIDRLIPAGTLISTSLRRHREAGAIIATGFVTFFVSSRTELYELVHAKLARYEMFQADELMFVLLSMLSALTVFSALRWHEARVEIASRISAELALQHMAERNRELARTLIDLQEAERRRIAHELHDHLGQSCNAIRIDAVCMCHSLALDSDEMAAARRIATTADELYQTVRGLLYELRPAALDSLGLLGALQSLCESWEERSSVSCALLPSGELSDLGETINIALYRVVQESLSNVMKHARASHVRITVNRSSDGAALDLSIEDDGVGCDTRSMRGGLGWIGMKERTSMLGGNLTIGQSRLGGILVKCRIPLPTVQGSCHQ